MTKKEETPLGATLRDLIDEKASSQATLAQTLGVSTSYVSAVINGRKAISGDTVERMANALHLQPQERTRLHRAAAVQAGFRLDLPDDF